MPNNKVSIKYTDRDFESIKKSLVSHAKRYYPDSYRDFNEASFGSLLMDTVSYVGDVLSFYLDYQANESFLETAQEPVNVVEHARLLGYNYSDSISSTGFCEFYIRVPVNTFKTGPDLRYAPILVEGTEVASRSGGNYYLLEDIDFSSSDNLMVVASVDEDNGAPKDFVIKATGQVRSGRLKNQEIQIGEFKKFPRVRIDDAKISEIVRVEDSDGFTYHEVRNLSQDVIYKAMPNRATNKESVPYIIKPFSVPRRFVANHYQGFSEIQFGQGNAGESLTGSYLDPSNVVMKQFGKFHVSDTYLDPTNFTTSDKLGIAPANTSINVTYRVNSPSTTNAESETVTLVRNPIFEFAQETKLDALTVQSVKASIEVSNDNPIVGDLTTPSVEEVKIRAKNTFAAQDRAVTKQDFVSMIYAMPSKFGAIKRCTTEVDMDSFKRNINIYVVSENSQGLVRTNSVLKHNVKKWINMYKMMGDTFDILDARIVNLSLDYSIVVSPLFNKMETLAECNRQLELYFSTPPEIGESLFLNDVYNLLNNLESVIDVTDVVVTNEEQAPYSTVPLIIRDHLSIDGKVLELPHDYIYEFKNPQADFRGTVVS